MDMNKDQAQQLARRIKNEAPHLTVSVGPLVVVGKTEAWVVYIDAEDFSEPQSIVSPAEWDLEKSAFVIPHL